MQVMRVFDNLVITAMTGSEFYQSIYDYFRSSRFQAELLPYLIIAFLLMFIAVAGGVIYMRWRASKRKYVPTGTMQDQARVRRALNQCIADRSRLDFQLNSEEGRNIFASCLPTDLTRDALILECFAASAPPTALYPGREIKFFFMIKEKQQEFYCFRANVIKTVITKKDAFQLYVTIPDQLSPGQKRNFLRITPPERLILGLYIWPLRKEERSLMSSASSWSKPSLIYTSEDSFQFKVRDLSASGAGLNISRAFANLEEISFGKARMFVLMLDLWDPLQQSPLKIWTICRVQASIPNKETGDLRLGVQFMAWGQTGYANPDSIVWRKLETDEGIAPLGDWIIKRHLEENRGYMPGGNFE